MSGLTYYIVVLLVYLFTDLLAAWGLNLEFGVAGVANFAYIALVAVGAYTYSVFTLGSPAAAGNFQQYVIGAHLNAALAIVIAAAVAAAAGVVIGLTGLRRLRPDYQAMTMLVISIMAGTVISADTGLVNGNAGLAAIPNPLHALGTPRDQWGYAILTGIICVAAFPALRYFTTGRMGRTLRAMRDDEDAAVAVGQNIVALRLVVQAVGGAFAGLSGALLAGFIGGWSPAAWQYVETLALLSAIIVGGLGDDFGVLAGTVVIPVLVLQGVQFLPSIRNHPQLIDDGGWIILGVLTIAFIWLRPQGVIPERRPRVKAAPPAAAPEVREAPEAPEANKVREAREAREAQGTTKQAAPQAVRDNTDLLVVTDLQRHYGGVRAVDGASITVPPRSITGLIGPNGAGKSTMLNVISGFAAADRGAVRFGGTDITGLQAWRRSRAGLVRTFQLPHEFARLTTIENLLVARDDPGRAAELLELFAMTHQANTLAGRLSGGQKRMLEVMRALMTRPKLLLLDEPMAGLSPAASAKLEEVLVSLRPEMSVLLVEHELGAVERICDHVIVMASGKVLSEGTMAELRTRAEVQQAYVIG
jgi:branched-chain amino acid transport system permease protein